MQLEMTKADLERDTEKLVELHKAEQEEKSELMKSSQDKDVQLNEIHSLKVKLENELKEKEEQLKLLQ